MIAAFKDCRYPIFLIASDIVLPFTIGRKRSCPEKSQNTYRCRMLSRIRDCIS